MTTWTRPTSVSLPTVWSTFKGNIIRNGVKNTFWIQDITDEYKDQILKHMAEDFTRDEPLCKYAKTEQDPQALNDFKNIWRNSFKENLGLVCLTKDSEGVTHIAGINCIVLSSKENEENTKLELNSDHSRIVLGTLVYPKSQVNPYEKLNITEYMDGMGLFVLPQYRGEGLGMELLKAREPLCRAVGLTASLTAFSSRYAQNAAKRVGFEELFSIDYDELEEKVPFLSFPGIQENSKSLILMYILYK